MRASEKAVRKMFRGMGFPEQRWDHVWLMSKVAHVAELVAGLTPPPDEDDRRLLDQLVGASERWETVELDLEENEVGKTGAVADKATANKKANGKGKPDKAVKRADDDKAKVDAFGCKVGSNRSKVLAKLSATEAKTLGQMGREAGVANATFTFFMAELVKRKLVVRDGDNGYKLPGKIKSKG